MRLQVDIPDDLFWELKRRQKYRSGEIVAQALMEYFKGREE